MRARLILDSTVGQARSHLLRTVLADAALKSGLQLVNDDADVELWLLVGEGGGDATLSGKTAFQGTVEDAAADPDAFLQRARAQAAPYQAGAAAPSASVAAAASGPKRVVAVTACPTGVAHTFMYGGRGHRSRGEETRLVGKARNPRVGRRRQCHHPRGSAGGGSGDCGGGY